MQANLYITSALKAAQQYKLPLKQEEVTLALLKDVARLAEKVLLLEARLARKERG